MDPHAAARVRPARPEDVDRLLALWDLLWEPLQGPPDAGPATPPWRPNGAAWLRDVLTGTDGARVAVATAGATVVATATGTLRHGPPNPHCPTGRAVQLENVVTDPAHRRQGHGAAVVRAVLDWARERGADRVDLGATADGLPLYTRLGFTPTSAPRLRLLLD